MAKIKREVLNSKVYIALKVMIADYRFQPGARLNVEKLTRELGVSRTPVWEAVRRLEQEGLLQNIPNRGVFMVEMTLERAFELFQVRGVLERLVGKLAAENIDNGTIKKMAKCLEGQLEVIERGDLIGYSQLDFDFHSMIYKITHNAFLVEMLDSIKTKMQPFGLHLKPILIQLYQDHMEIFEALRSKNPEAAEKAFIQHNQKILNRIKEQIESEAERIRVSRQLKNSHVRAKSLAQSGMT
jgi:DNA-binding GntR family transcriptional regulator